MHRARGSMHSLQQLTCIPNVSTSVEEGDCLDALRKTPLVNESQIGWACQTGNDESSRIPLPAWLSSPLERKIMEWSRENAKWKDRVEERASKGLDLPPASKKKYMDFQENLSRFSFLFSKSKQRVVHKVKNKGEWKRMRADFLSVEVKMAEDPANLQVIFGDNAPLRLVLLKGEASKTDLLPKALAESGVSDAAGQAAMQADAEETSDSGCDDVENGREQQERELERMEKSLMEESEGEELLIMSGDEDDIEAFQTEKPDSKFARVKDFFHRQVYKDMEAKGLTMVPPQSILSYHKTTCTWQGYFQGKSVGLTFRHDGKQNRDESECLWAVLKGLAERHCELNPRDKLWQAQLRKLKDMGLKPIIKWCIGVQVHERLLRQSFQD